MGWDHGVRGWFKACLRPCPSSLYEAQPTISRAAAVPFVRRSDESAQKMVGWTPCKIVGPSISREVELATTPGSRPTHPTLPNQPVNIAARGNKSRRKKISRNRMIFIPPVSTHPRSRTRPRDSLGGIETSGIIAANRDHFHFHRPWSGVWHACANELV